jgi:TolA-binding protein
MTRHRAIPLFLGVIFALAPVGMVSCQDGGSPTKNGKGAPKAPNDLPLVERVLAARKEYQTSLEALREHYIKVNNLEGQKAAEDELLSYHRISKRAYRLDLDVPPPTLKPEYNQPEANELLRRAVGFKKSTSFGGRDDNYRRAEILLQQLLSNYPQSDKIDDAAYELGEVYESTAFKQPKRAAMYYERCFQWNPNTTTDARMRAARLYDKTLNDRSKAIQLYQDVLNHHTSEKELSEAQRRLAELSSTPR